MHRAIAIILIKTDVYRYSIPDLRTRHLANIPMQIGQSRPPVPLYANPEHFEASHTSFLISA